MSADVLRRAAALMRERAEGADSGPWMSSARLCDILRPHSGWWDEPLADATHIASWHPAVALAVADWLEETHAGLSTHNAMTTTSRAAFTVARTYLGEHP